MLYERDTVCSKAVDLAGIYIQDIQDPLSFFAFDNLLTPQFAGVRANISFDERTSSVTFIILANHKSLSSIAIGLKSRQANVPHFHD